MTKFILYQIKLDLVQDKGFMSLKTVVERFKKIVLNDYDMIYIGEINDSDIKTALERLFHTFNRNIAEDYKGRPISISDIIMVRGIYYYCDLFGFKEIDPDRSWI